MESQSKAQIPVARRILREVYKIPHIGDLALGIATLKITKNKPEEEKRTSFTHDPKNYIEDTRLISMAIENLRRNNSQFAGSYETKEGEKIRREQFSSGDYTSLQKVISEGFKPDKYMDVWIKVNPKLKEGILEFDMGTVIAPAAEGRYKIPARKAPPTLTARIFFSIPK